MNPAVSVIVVSDYGGGEAKAWNHLRATLAALARQDFQGPTEFLLSERAAFKHQIPDDLLTILPSLKLVLSETSSSYELKNEGVLAASADIVAILDADCVPDMAWLGHLMETLRSHPKAAAVSGRTLYAGLNLTDRVLGLLSRSYLDPGRAGKTRFISNNNMACRRSVYLDYPLPTDAGPFASRLQSEAIVRSGGQLRFEPRMLVVHDFEGWSMEADIRRNIGYGTVITRLRDPLQPFAWLTRIGYASVPLFAAGKTLDSFLDCIRCGRYYHVRWYELPIAFLLAVVVHAMEVPGMIRAFRGRELAETAYR
ncbi:MAG: glycosyltransferase family A protein [Candidatus Binatia bacterium]